MPVGNNKIFGTRISQLIEFLSCFSTIMSAFLVKRICKLLENSRVVIQECQFTWLSILDKILCL